MIRATCKIMMPNHTQTSVCTYLFSNPSVIDYTFSLYVQEIVTNPLSVFFAMYQI